MTIDLAALALHAPSITSDGVIIGNGSGLSISNIGSFSLTFLPTPSFFSNVLHVPAMSKNLISVSTLCADNPINVLFFDSFFQVQDHHTGVTLVHEQHRERVYCWSKSVPLQSSALALSSSTRSSLIAISIWHGRLHHLFFPIFQKFLSALSIYFHEEHLCSFSCSSYSNNKSHKLPFAQSSITSSSPLDVIFSDVWTSHVSFSNGFHYYVIFVDHFTKYIWFYPLHRKSDVCSTFVVFKQRVENYFTTTIKTLYTDNGGEFLALRSFLATHGITHLTTPPHTPEHNAYSKR